MALTIREQLNILDGTVIPSDTDSTFKLEDVVRQVTIGQAYNIIKNNKEPDRDVSPLAWQYIEKMSKTASTALTISRTDIFQSVTRLIISIYSATGVIATVIAADEDAWTTFVENTILEAYETYSGIKPTWKTEYDAL